MRYLVVSLLALLTIPAIGCSSGGGGDGQRNEDGKRLGDVASADPVSAERIRSVRLGDQRQIRPSELSAQERQRLSRAWNQFLQRSPMWRMSLRSIVADGGAGPYILSENLFRYFFQASIHSQKAEVRRVAQSVRQIGEPAVAYFAKPLVTDLVPLGKEVVVEVPDPDDPKSRIKKKMSHFQIDDYTRRDAASVLAEIGAPAVPTLASRELLYDARPSGRRYAAFALGKIGNEQAISALTGLLANAPDWQDRAAAAKALGAALKKSPAPRAALERGTQDPDPFVRRKAEEALAGKSKLPF